MPADLEATSVRLVVRWYGGDSRCHRYWVAQVEDPTCEYLVPVCREFPYPWRHPREMLGDHDLTEPGSPFDACSACDVWTRHHRHTVIVRGEVFA